MPTQWLHLKETTTMANLRRIIIFNGLISKVPSSAIIGTITSSWT